MARFLLLGAMAGLPIAASAQVRISEVAWMGTSVSANDEWIELENTGDESLTVDGWVLAAGDGQPLIPLKGTIVGKGYVLLERTDDATVPNIPADAFYKGSLANSGEHLVLKNEKGEIVDQLDASGGWSFGSNTTKETMQLVGDRWGSGVATPRAKNSIRIPAPAKASVVSRIVPAKEVSRGVKSSTDVRFQEKTDPSEGEEAKEQSSSVVAAASGGPSSQFGKNMLWLVASISAGLLVGLGVRAFTRSRER